MGTHTASKSMDDRVRTVVNQTPVLDVHTHIYDTGFGDLLLWGIDELVTYHYLIAEVYRVAPMPFEKFWALSTAEQADHIWQHLFIERSPVSEACRGVLTTMRELGFNPADRNLEDIRAWTRERSVDEYIDLVFKTAGVRRAVMTNDPFDDAERAVWLDGKRGNDDRFIAALRIDRLLVDWDGACDRLSEWGYEVEPRLGGWTLSEIRRFLEDWIARMDPVYLAASLPPTFTYPDDSPCGRIIEECILPVAREHGLPFAMMVGVKKLVNPNLQLAGDSVGKSDITALEHLCEKYPDNRFLVTMLSRENQHELCVTARKFPNLMIFGCWWFLNNPSIIDEMTSERLELLGLSMVPQHSDARVLDQLIYKWTHSRDSIARVLGRKYEDLAATGWDVTDDDIRRDVALLFGGVFESFTGI